MLNTCKNFLKPSLIRHFGIRHRSMLNVSKILLKTRIPTNIQTRESRNTMAESKHAFEAKISEETPAVDYKKLIQEHLQMVDVDVDTDNILDTNFRKIAAVTRDMVWKLLFVIEPLTKVNQIKAGDLLEEYKSDAAFYEPYTYNEWIVTVRDEVLKREMLDFWRIHMVKRELGPCWAKDSDLFDDLNDPEPEAFYKYAGCVAPFSKEAQNHTSEENLHHPEILSLPMIPPKSPAARSFHDFAPKLSLVNPCEEYKQLVQDNLQMDFIVLDGVLEENFSKISAVTRETIWKLLFDKQPAPAENLTKAANLLEEHRTDVCFYSAYPYNEWIVNVRDELLKRKMFDFWRDVIVAKALGPCWAKDSDLFDDLEDPEPEAYYKHAGCVAPFSKEAKKQKKY